VYRTTSFWREAQWKRRIDTLATSPTQAKVVIELEPP
jgi:hypothetical protein